jgi:hypothetical protein
MAKEKAITVSVRHCDEEWSNEGTFRCMTDALYEAERVAKRLHVNESVWVGPYQIAGKRRLEE